MGLVELVKHLWRISRIKDELVREAKRRKCRTAILVDFPGFNLAIAPQLKALGIELVYYVCPQIWAWGYKRVKKIAKYFSVVIPVLPFEEDLLKKEGVEAHFFGHPLTQIIEPRLTESEFRKKFDLHEEFVVLLPGSRAQELKYTLQPILEGFRLINTRLKLQGVLIVAPGVNITDYVDELPEGVRLVPSPCYDALFYGELGIVVSGSASLECALAELPSIILYKCNGLSYWFLKRMATVKNIGLPNILLGEQIFPELLQERVKPEAILKETERILPQRETIKNQLKGLRDILYRENPSRMAAQFILDFVGK